MTRKPSPTLDNRASQICGLIVGVCIVLPPLMRLADGRWESDDWVLLVLGILLTITWSVIAIRGVRKRRHERDELAQLRSDS